MIVNCQFIVIFIEDKMENLSVTYQVASDGYTSLVMHLLRWKPHGCSIHHVTGWHGVISRKFAAPAKLNVSECNLLHLQARNALQCAYQRNKSAQLSWWAKTRLKHSYNTCSNQRLPTVIRRCPCQENSKLSKTNHQNWVAFYLLHYLMIKHLQNLSHSDCSHPKWVSATMGESLDWFVVLRISLICMLRLHLRFLLFHSLGGCNC